MKTETRNPKLEKEVKMGMTVAVSFATIIGLAITALLYFSEYYGLGKDIGLIASIVLMSLVIFFRFKREKIIKDFMKRILSTDKIRSEDSRTELGARLVVISFFHMVVLETIVIISGASALLMIITLFYSVICFYELMDAFVDEEQELIEEDVSKGKR